VLLQEGSIEWGESRTLVSNSLGLRASFGGPVGSASLWVVGGAEHHGPREVSSLRHSVSFSELDAIDPTVWVEEASWRAAASIAGRPVSGRGVSVLLDPRSAAAWVRHGLPKFIGRGPRAAPGAEGNSSAPRPGFDVVDGAGEGVLDGEGRPAHRRIVVKDGRLVSYFADSNDASAPEGLIGPMRRDSYRDEPAPGPMHLCVRAGGRGRDPMLASIGEGLFVSALTPRSGPGAESFLAEVRGVWVERGRAVHPVAGTLMRIPAMWNLPIVTESGSDTDLDPSGPPISSPSLRIEGADLGPL
jgi:predicted Zn-dependent protease